MALLLFAFAVTAKLPPIIMNNWKSNQTPKMKANIEEHTYTYIHIHLYTHIHMYSYTHTIAQVAVTIICINVCAKLPSAPLPLVRPVAVSRCWVRWANPTRPTEWIGIKALAIGLRFTGFEMTPWGYAALTGGMQHFSGMLC